MTITIKKFTAALLLLLLCGSVSAMQSVNPTESVQPPLPPRHVQQLIKASAKLWANLDSIMQVVTLVQTQGIAHEEVRRYFSVIGAIIPIPPLKGQQQKKCKKSPRQKDSRQDLEVRQQKLQDLVNLLMLKEYIYDYNYMTYLLLCLQHIYDNYDTVTKQSILAFHRDIVVRVHLELTELYKVLKECHVDKCKEIQTTPRDDGQHEFSIKADVNSEKMKPDQRHYIELIMDSMIPMIHAILECMTRPVGVIDQKKRQIIEIQNLRKPVYTQQSIVDLLDNTLIPMTEKLPKSSKYHYIHYTLKMLRRVLDIEKRVQQFFEKQYEERIPREQYKSVRDGKSRTEKFQQHRCEGNEWTQGSNMPKAWDDLIVDYLLGRLSYKAQNTLLQNYYECQNSDYGYKVVQRQVLARRDLDWAIKSARELLPDLDNSYLYNSYFANQTTADPNGPSSSTDINAGDEASDSGQITWTLDDSYFDESQNNEEGPDEEEEQEGQSAQNFEDVVYGSRRPADNAIINALCTTKNRKALKFLAAVMGRKHIVKISDFAVFLRVINGVKIKETKDGSYQTIPLQDTTVLTTYWVPNLSDDPSVDTWNASVHQPHGGGEEFSRNSLNFIKRYLALKGYEPVWQETQRRLVSS